MLKPFMSEDLRMLSHTACSLILFMSLLQSVCANEFTSSCAKVDRLILQLRWTRDAQFAGFYAALKKKYFSEECLEVSFRTRDDLGKQPEELLLSGDADLAVSWSMDKARIPAENRTVLKTVAQIFRRAGYNKIILNPLKMLNISTYTDIAAASDWLGRPLTVAATDDAYNLFAGLSILNVTFCRTGFPQLTAISECEGPVVGVEVFDKSAATAPADLFTAHVKDPLVRQLSASNGTIVWSETVSPLHVATPFLEDGISVAWYPSSAVQRRDVFRRFLRAAFKGWIFCRDWEVSCAEAVGPDLQLRQKTIFEIREINKLIWPSVNGIGKIDEDALQDSYNYAAASGFWDRGSLNVSDDVIPDIAEQVVDELENEGFDVYGNFFQNPEFQRSLSICSEDPSGPLVLCEMHCNPGHEPPFEGKIFWRDQCVPCKPGFASPGGEQMCVRCAEGTSPSPGASECVRKSDSGPDAALVISLVAVGFVTLTVLLVGLYLWRRNAQLRDALHTMHGIDEKLDTESPYVKALSFLGDVAEGRHNHLFNMAKRHELQKTAGQIRAMLLSSRNILAPDVSEQMLHNDIFSKDIVRFVDQQALGGRYDNSESSELAQSISLNRIGSIDAPGTCPVPGSGGELRPADLPEDIVAAGWSFEVDALRWAAACPENLLGEILVRLVVAWGIDETLSLDCDRLRVFARVIEEGHFDNPYHCLAHTIDVTVRMATILNKSGIVAALSGGKNRTGSLTLLAALLSAAVHDYKHVGFTNRYLVQRETNLSIQFNDQSVLENRSLRDSLQLLREGGTSFFRRLSHREMHHLRSMIIRMVLSTDMANHFSILTSIQTKLADGHKQKGSSFSSGSMYPFSRLSEEQQMLLLQLCLKAADIGHCCLPTRLHIMWVERLQREMWRQGDDEKAHGLPVSPLADREKPGALYGSNQVGFFQALACPMYDMLVAVLPGCVELQQGIHANLRFWQENLEHPPAHLLPKNMRNEHAVPEDGDNHEMTAGGRALASLVYVEDLELCNLIDIPGSP
uniref:Phosphodiesterase n=1 Tax=Tetraselmis sp. GSL018 TaxID=582737 RepID=A0A061RQT9_9CHLO